jgi:hypothetical protein
MLATANLVYQTIGALTGGQVTAGYVLKVENLSGRRLLRKRRFSILGTRPVGFLRFSPELTQN